jgi:hypothetical protein
MNSRGTKLQLDIDFKSKAGLLKFIGTVWPFLFQFDWPHFGQLEVEDVRVSRTGHGYHVEIVVANEIEFIQLILLQAMFGSDIRRENHNLGRVTCTLMRPWDVLYDWKFKYYWKFRGRRMNEYRTISRERPDVELSKQIRRLIRKFQRNRECS